MTTVQRIALLAARFQLRVAASRLCGVLKSNTSLANGPAWKGLPSKLEDLRDWPAFPYSLWFAAGKDTRRDLPPIPACRMLVGTLARDLPKDNIGSLIQALKLAEDTLPKETSP